MRSEAIKRARERVLEASETTSRAAAAEVEANSDYRSRQCARKKVNNVMLVIDTDFPNEIEKQLARPYAEQLASALMWEQRDTIVAAQFMANVFPCYDEAELRVFAENAVAQTAQDTARALRIVREKRQVLGLTMIGACDLSDEEYKTLQKDERKAKDAARKRLGRSRTHEQRREEEKAKDAQIRAYANAKGVTPKTVRNWIATGKVRLEDVRENGVRTISYSSGRDFPGVGAAATSRVGADSRPDDRGPAPRLVAGRDPLDQSVGASLVSQIPGTVDRVLRLACDSLSAHASTKRSSS